MACHHCWTVCRFRWSTCLRLHHLGNQAKRDLRSSLDMILERLAAFSPCHTGSNSFRPAICCMANLPSRLPNRQRSSHCCLPEHSSAHLQRRLPVTSSDVAWVLWFPLWFSLLVLFFKLLRLGF